jgi:hypothetical protein
MEHPIPAQLVAELDYSDLYFSMEGASGLFPIAK